MFVPGQHRQQQQQQQEQGTAAPITASQRIRQQIEAGLQQEERRRKAVVQPQKKLEANPWLRRVGWAEHLAGFAMEELQQHAELPAEEQKRWQQEQ